MDKDYLFDLVRKAVERLYTYNADLFASTRHNENTFCSKLANYIEQIYHGFAVDYDLNSRSVINGIVEEKKLSNIPNKTYVRPDIIIHHRGTDDENLVAIEVKGFWNRQTEDWKNDNKKLIGFTSPTNGDFRPFHYKLGIFIALAPTFDCVEYTLYSDGEQISTKSPEQILNDFKKYKQKKDKK